ncbi:MAG: hypothetical protein ACOC39_02360 [Desulfovermiculus sp.]
MRIVFWWAFFTAVCIWIQNILPGIDCFGPALLVLLHLQRYKEAAWLTPVWIVVNEGAGTLAFGLSILWIGGLVLFFFILCQYLSSSNFAFLLTLSILAGIWQTATLKLMLTLQELNLPADLILLQGIKTALVFPLLWVGMLTAFKRWGQRRHVSS